MKLACEPVEVETRVAIVGAGETGRRVYLELTKSKVKVDLVVDSNSNLHGTRFYPTELIVSNLDLLHDFEGDVVVACAGNHELLRTLSVYNIRVLNFFYNYLVNRSDYDCWASRREELNKISLERIEESSRDALDSIVRAATEGYFLDAFKVTDLVPFFGPKKLEIHKGDVLLDLGSYRGRHLKSLSERDIVNLAAVICVEPNEGNNDFLLNLFNHVGLADLWIQKLTICNVAVKEFAGFGYNSNSVISNSIVAHSNQNNPYNEKIPIVTLNAFAKFRPTIITCDIEGDELGMLNGGKELIFDCKPRMAISSYHNCSDIFDIIQFFDSLEVGVKYRFSLHDYGFMDQVIYVSML